MRAWPCFVVCSIVTQTRLAPTARSIAPPICLPTSVADCADPKPNAFPVDNVFTLIASDFAKDADQGVLDYLKKRSWGNDTVNKMMAWMTDNQATGEEGAREFLRTHEEMWTQWVSPEAAEKIKSAL